MRLEMCIICDEPTDKAGQCEDSNYCDDCGNGPYCDDCFDKHIKKGEIIMTKHKCDSMTDELFIDKYDNSGWSVAEDLGDVDGSLVENISYCPWCGLKLDQPI